MTDQAAAAIASLDAGRILARCADLRAISADPERYLRSYLTPEHRAAAELLLGWIREAGMTARLDAAGNVVGRLERGGADAPAVVLGSHFDTVPDAGRYDGILGLVTAIECAGRLAASGRRLACPLEVYGFADEEGTRFHRGLLASGLVAGLPAGGLLELSDDAGVTLRAALTEFGLDPDTLRAAARRPGDFRAYLELHIEQGPVLEATGLALGTVTSIAAQLRLQATVSGVAGHAGTVPMRMRRDALTAAAEAVLAVEAVALGDPGVVATVGELAPEPGGSNVIPGRVRFSIDLRSSEPSHLTRARSEIERRLREVAARRGTPVSIELVSGKEAVACDPALAELIDRACAGVTGRAFRLASGAGHDAASMARLCAVGMIFVRCKDGLSHNPLEDISEADAGAGLAALSRVVGDLVAAP